MDEARFDALTRTFTAERSRRQAVAAALSSLFLLGARPADAKKGKKQHKKKPLGFNTFGCLDVGKACRGNSGNCCSGICEGRKPKKGKKDTSLCVAHNTGGCTEDSCLSGMVVPCGTGGTCTRTTGQANFCGRIGGVAAACTVCRKDTDCQAGFGLGAACIVCAVNCPATTTVCIAPAA